MATSARSDKREDLKRDRDRFVGFAFAAADTLIELDRDRRVRYAAGQPIGGADIVGRDFADMVVAENRASILAALEGARHGGRIAAQIVRFADGEPSSTPRILSGWCLPDLDGHVFLALHAAPADAPDVDAETGLMDGDDFRAAVSKAVAEGDLSGAMTLIDVAGLDDVRDRLPSVDSDRLMERVGAVLRGSATGGTLAGRTGPQTFGVVRHDSVDVGEMTRTLDEIVRAADPAGRGARVREGSIVLDGGALSREETAQAVLYAMRKFADSPDSSVALGTLSECCTVMVSDSMDRLARFKRAVTEDDFRIVVQPIVDIATRRVRHYEVLSRFGDAAGASPQSMIAFAEEVGVIADFDVRVVERAVAMMVGAQAAGCEDLSLAVNLSMRTVERDDIVAVLGARLGSREELRARLVIEITETARIRDIRAANRAVQALRRAGHKVCLDDFGAGAAAFDYLRTFEVDAIKIDGSYVTRAVAGTRSRAFLKAMASLCLDTGVDVVAEQVEDEATAEFLLGCGVRYGQGYHFGRPGPLADYLASNGRAPAATESLTRRSRRILAPADRA